MTTYRCATCSREQSSGLTRLLDPRYARGKCLTCGVQRTFRQWDAGPQDRGQVRHTDPPTAKAAAQTVRTGSAKMALLRAHASHRDGLTDEEAATYAGLSLVSEYATRCSELMRAGYLEDTSDTRVGASGMSREVRKITSEGVRIAKEGDTMTMDDPPMIEMPRPTPEMVEQYLRQAMPIATKAEIASRVAEVIMTDALGRAVHHGRTPGGLLDLPKCTRVNSKGAVEDVPYNYDDPTHPEYLCVCEQIAGGLITIMKLLEIAEAKTNRLVLSPGDIN